ncbi:hypothetical protein [Pseudomonas aeruginosa]|uniref:hypothetical protein n=1 Tax=Pseudomonas aeruginosa TaxID=287 RepID=UPI000F7D6005|nr:hypothetical protein [Pseudomonas aeruginosa]RTB44144.1 hypothetical protein EJ655_08385 [Pseudomonas aeruginosa]
MKILPSMRGLFHRSAWRSFLWALLVVLAAVLVNIVGIHAFGSIEGWQHWMDSQAGFFLAWRVVLYVGVGWFWMRMHLKLREREPGTETHQRLLRIEIAAVLAVLALEASLWRL